jgi:malonyl-CoA decarboxylase
MPSGRVPLAADARELQSLASSLLSEPGEASGVALARQILASYAALSAAERLVFLEILAERFGPDPVRLRQVIDRYREDPSPSNASALFAASEPPRQELIRRLNLAPGGTERLVHMREDVLANLRDHPGLSAVDADFVHLLSSWFNRGFLQIRPIDWTAPAHILEKVIRYEAVHEIKSWGELQRRLEPRDRRCFAFFHPALPDEPLIFVEVALTASIPQAIIPLLSEGRRPIAPERARTAVFYSISNCQVGLKGIHFGNFLIKQVAEELKRELPNLRTFVTLSPVPELMQWLKRERAAASPGFVRAAHRKALAALDGDWTEDANALKVVRPFLNRAAAYYFLRGRNGAGKPIDPVARFHLGNGARLDRVNWMGDPSPKGIRESAGIMVNYRYDLGQVEKNHDAYANRSEVVASRGVHKLLES